MRGAARGESDLHGSIHLHRGGGGVNIDIRDVVVVVVVVIVVIVVIVVVVIVVVVRNIVVVPLLLPTSAVVRERPRYAGRGGTISSWDDVACYDRTARSSATEAAPAAAATPARRVR